MTAVEAAASVGASDLFVLRRVSGARFVHLGGSGRGEGWAGIVEVGLDEEGHLARALETGEPAKLERGGRELVFGPYYARAAAIVPVSADVVVVFGVSEGVLESGEGALRTAAVDAVAAVEPSGPAKHLSDVLEVLEGLQAALGVPSHSVEQAMRSLAEVAATALSCELGIVYVDDRRRLAVAERGWPLAASEAEVAAGLRETLGRHEFPYCVQDARTPPLPGPLAEDRGFAPTTCWS